MSSYSNLYKYTDCCGCEESFTQSGSGAQGAQGSQGARGATGAQGAQGATGPVIPYNINLQAIPVFPFSSGGPAALYHSIAFSEPDCRNFSVTTICDTNSYEFALYECGFNTISGHICPTAFSDAKATHTNNIVCVNHPNIKLDYCSIGVGPNLLNRYFCCITGGPGGPPFEDAFIEWFYLIETNNVSAAYVTGKFTFMANKDYILNVHTTLGYNGPGGIGIPLFNPSNHNQ